MKILHINTYYPGGAATSCLRLHEALLSQNIDSNLLLESSNVQLPQSVLFKETKQVPVKNKIYYKAQKVLQEFKIKLPDVVDKEKIIIKKQQELLTEWDSKYELFSFPSSVRDLTTQSIYQQADIIHFHWVSRFLDWGSFFKKNKKPVVWTLHDMNPFTGGCHYDLDCGKFTTDCSYCPQLPSEQSASLAALNLEQKLSSISQVEMDKLHIVAPSRWLLDRSKSSRLFQKYNHHHIPYSLDTDVFKLHDRKTARDLLKIPLDKTVILFVADNLKNYRKGYHLLLDSLQFIQNKEQIVLCTVGNSDNQANSGGILTCNLGKITDERIMSLAYNAANVFVTPSIADNLPNTILESICCGTPVIGFNIGGIPDMVENELNGYLCEEVSVANLAEKINLFLRNVVKFSRETISQSAIQKYSHKVQADSYVKLYKQLLIK